jgi:proline- and glutamine-rich splicing factor
MERVMAISGPSHELPPQETTEKKFSGRNRLYIGNLTNDVSEEEIQNMFQKYGEVSELFVNKEKSFAFLRMVIINYMIVIYSYTSYSI